MLRFGWLLALSAGAACGTPITFTFVGTATGTLGTTPFTAASYTVTSSADTSDVLFTADNYWVTAISSSIDIAGLPSLTFTDPMFWADPQGAGDIVFGDLSTDPSLFPGILGITVLFQGLETYNLQSSFGPVYSPIDFPSSIFDSFQDIPTNEGLLSLVASDETFQATEATTPEPGSMLLAAIGLAGLPAVRRRMMRT
jgi:MYXO-CTERM domain-containing protein